MAQKQRTAVANVRYVALRNPTGFKRVQAATRYITRESEAVREHPPQVWGHDGPIPPEKAQAAIRELLAQHGYAQTLVLSPNPELRAGEWSLDEWHRFTERSMQALEHCHHGYLAVYHPDPEHPHVHVIAATDRTLRRDDLRRLDQATQEAVREIERERTRERTHELEHGRML